MELYPLGREFAMMFVRLVSEPALTSTKSLRKHREVHGIGLNLLNMSINISSKMNLTFLSAVLF